MPRKKSDAPSYRYHVSGQAVVTFEGKNYYLVPHNSPESKARYYALLNQYHVNGMAMPAEPAQHDAPITIRVVTAEYREYSKGRYSRNPQELNRVEGICDLLELEYGDLPASEFGPRRLAELRETFIANGNCRTYVNRLVRGTKRIFKHAISRELIDVEVLIRLDSLEPLRAGQSNVRESVPVEPVKIEDVQKTTACLSVVDSSAHLSPHQSQKPPRSRIQGGRHDHDAVRHDGAKRSGPLSFSDGHD